MFQTMQRNNLERQLLRCEISETPILYMQGSFEMKSYSNAEHKVRRVRLHILKVKAVRRKTADLMQEARFIRETEKRNPFLLDDR